MGKSFKIPIAVIIFNRPDCAKRLIEIIRQVKPEQFFVISDGPRIDRPEEKSLVEECRRIMTPDWDCHYHQFFAAENMQCRERIVSGLNELFSIVDSAIILEDDCIPRQTFFTFCQQMLEHYKDNDEVMSVCGMRVFPKSPKNTITFSRYHNGWGWATWKRAWDKNNESLPDNFYQTLQNTFRLSREKLYWKYILESVECKKIVTWDYLWMFSCWQQEGLNIYPPASLVNNIGSGENATHTVNLPYYLRKNSQDIDFSTFELPSDIETTSQADRWIEDHMYSKSIRGRFLWFLDKLGVL